MKKIYRRVFIKLPLLGFFTGLGIKSVQAQYLTQTDTLSDNNPQAISLGYRMNIASIDRLRWTQFIPGQSCISCTFYQGSKESTQGPCKIFGGQLVMATGWCSAYERLQP